MHFNALGRFYILAYKLLLAKAFYLLLFISSLLFLTSIKYIYQNNKKNECHMKTIDVQNLDRFYKKGKPCASVILIKQKKSHRSI